MGKIIAQHIRLHRKRLKMTQDQFGSQYNVSGPAIFKIEKGFVQPSLELWLKMSKPLGIELRQAVLMWVKDKLPEQYRDAISLEGNLAQSKSDFSHLKTDAKLRAAMLKDKWLPSGLQDLAKSDSLWAMYKPKGSEIDLLRDIFSKLGEGTARGLCDGLKLVREFRGKSS